MKKRLILFMPSMEGGGVEKNLILIANYISNFTKYSTITFDDGFNKFFNKKITILNATKKSHKNIQNIINIFIVYLF